jgi:hypothetical protein
MHVDFKITAWERVEIPEDRKEVVLAALEDGRISTANDLIEFLEAMYEEGYEYKGMVLETEEQMLPEENDGQPTIEFFSEKGQLKADWQNGNY